MSSNLPEGKRVIKIGAQKPTFVFGYANPDSTIQKWLSRSYSYGHTSAGQILRGMFPFVLGATTLWFISSYIVG